jgi:hypothetical protein
MNGTTEKRLTKRFTQPAHVEIRFHNSSGWRGEGHLVDCSEGGVGLCATEAMRRNAVILLRVCEQAPSHACAWDKEAGPFHMVTAKVCWCREDPSSGGASVFRIGGRRMLPFY